MEKLRLQTDKYAPFLARLEALYTQKDKAYQEAAVYYGFHCTGCEDNCCLTRFYHHTFLEYLYIFEGYNRLEPEKQTDVKAAASEVCRKTAQADEKGQPVRLMCPLNIDGFCLLYTYRPMICRLHGIPYELRRPEGNILYGPGCDAFTAQCGERPYFRFDRTPFYSEMAALEKELRQALGMNRKLKLTIAEMLA